MAKGYWIVHITVEDAENYPDYMKAASAAVAAHGGQFLVRGGQYEVVEGTGRERHVIVEFDSFEAAKAAYFAEDYQAAAKLRQAYAQTDLIIIEGAD